jgi:RNA polymerase sigma-70 factor (ECF subfamily)
VETDVVERAQRGDRAAFGLIAAEIATRFLAISRRILRDLDLAEDATQQALVGDRGGICRGSATRRASTPGRTGLLVRACYAEGSTEPPVVARTFGSLPADEPSESGGLDAIVYHDQLERAMRRLSVDHRTVLVLHHYADIPVDRVAQILEIPVGTVHSRLHHAMRAMRAALDADERPAAAEATR